jgi:hypothetical protein
MDLLCLIVYFKGKKYQIISLKVEKEARKCSVNYRKRLDVHPNHLANALFLKQPVARRLKRLYPGDLVINS